jgi:hypothetical protein
MPIAIAPTINTIVMPAPAFPHHRGRGRVLRDPAAAEGGAKGVGARHHGDDAGKGERGGGRIEPPGEDLCQEARDCTRRARCERRVVSSAY